jgi:hypothetical protein
MTLAQGAWASRAELWLGDYVTVDLKVGSLDLLDSSTRCTGLGFSIDDDGSETVAVGTGLRRAAPSEQLSSMTRNLNAFIQYPRLRADYLGRLAARVAAAKKKG